MPRFLWLLLCRHDLDQEGHQLLQGLEMLSVVGHEVLNSSEELAFLYLCVGMELDDKGSSGWQ